MDHLCVLYCFCWTLTEALSFPSIWPRGKVRCTGVLATASDLEMQAGLKRQLEFPEEIRLPSQAPDQTSSSCYRVIGTLRREDERGT
ncbi:hypothetical protein AOLI_G00146060 [Acnodon oligacanthus]